MDTHMTPTWMQQAACKSKPSKWFGPEAVRLDRDAARTVCKSCPVQTDCLTHGTRHGESGIWGGRMLHRGHLADRRAS